MVSELIAYIEEAKKKGFALDQIEDHLSNHGWNDYLIEYAMNQVKRREDRKWLSGSLMAVALIFVATAGTVWWVESSPAWSPGNIACILEANDGSINPIPTTQGCCDRLQPPCNRFDNGPQVRDTKGNILFQAELACPSSEGRILTSQSTIHECRAAQQ